MKVPERNALIDECISEFEKIHHEYFPRGDCLSDEKYEELINKMNDVAEKYKKDIPNISGDLCMAFLDDIEEYHKKWKKYKQK